jgi:hypothetical protein
MQCVDKRVSERESSHDGMSQYNLEAQCRIYASYEKTMKGYGASINDCLDKSAVAKTTNTANLCWDLSSASR